MSLKIVLGAVAALSALFATSAIADDVYERGTFLCISEKSVGFKVEDGEWKEVNFTTGRKFIFRPLKDGDFMYFASEAHAYGVFEFGNDFPRAWTNDGFGFSIDGEWTPTPYVTATGLSAEFSMNKETMRYISNYLGDWIEQPSDAEQTEGNDIAIEIGSCTRL